MLRDQSLDNTGFHSGGALPTYPYSSATSIRYPERPRPSSARDPVYVDSLEGGYLNQMGPSRMRGPNTINLQSPYDGRPSSMDRGSNYPPTNRSCYLSAGQRSSRSNVPLSNYPTQTALYQPNVTSYPFSQSGLLQQSQRRAHSYEINLEKQGLCEYANVLAAAGATQNNPSLNVYGNYGSDRADGVGNSMPLMTPIIGYGNQGMPQNTNYSGMGISGSSGVMTMSNSIDVATMQRECVRLHQELDITKEKLNACMTSIRTFWSPELKRERAMRKEENAKYAILADHLHQLQLEKQTMLQALQNSDAELRRERELHSSRFKTGDSEANELEVARRRIEELTRENRVLTKSVEDAEKRCSNLQASLTATEESLRRLVEAVRTGKAAAANQVAGAGAGQAKTQSSSPGTTGAGADATTGDSLANIRIDRLESDRLEIERLREQLNEACHRNSEVEKTLIECEMERSQLKEEVELVSQDLEMARHETESLRQNIRETQTLQALVDTKESKILTLENEIRLLEDEITRLRDEGITTPNTSLSSGIEDVDRTLNTFRSNERLLKSKVDFLTSELSKRESEIYALQSRLEMTEKQQQDQNHHISVLKEQVKARENKVTMLTADIEDFRKRLKEKEGLLEKKTKLLGTNTTSKRQLETEVTELKDQIDLKERKISLLQRKIENLEELVTEKESQLAGAKSRLSRLNTEKTGSDGSKANLEDTLKEKDRQIERLKENLQRLENETNEEMESQKRLQSELRSRLDISLRDLDEKTAQLAELREEMAQLRSVRYKRDTEISQLQSQIGQRDAEISSLKLEKQMLQKQVTTESEMKYSKIVSDLEGQVNHYMESASKLQTEVDRLLSMIRNSDSEKLDKDNQIHELEEQLHDAQNQISSLKRAQQMDRKKNAQFLDEARQRADNIQSDAEVLKNMMSEKEVRIRELEQALRESVRLTAEREAHVASREDSTRQLEQQIRELRSNVEHLQRERNNLSAQLASQQEELRDRESQLKNLESDCFQGYIPELEKLRRANQDANLKIAALIKLVHGHEEHLTEQDRSVLATIPMFPGFATKGPLGGKLQTRPWGPTSGSVPNVGLLAPGIGGTGGGASGTAYLGTGASTGGATSPHFAGSAFQLIGSNSAAATAAALSAGGISMPMQTADSVLLGRLLHEKETMLQQQLQDLTRLRFQNSEMEVKMKALQRDLENKNTRLNALESSQTADIVTGLGDWQTPMSRIQVAQAELTTLRQSNAELREKLAQAQTTLQERENELQRLQLSQTSAATLEIERLKLELAKIKEEREAMERNLRMEVNQLTDDMNRSNNAAVNAEAELQDKKDKIRLLEFEQVKATTEASALQKKYQTVLGQLTERTDKLQLLEKECQQNHLQEIQRLKSENEDLNHRVTYLHRNNQEREAKLEQQETELSKQKDELSNVKKQAHCLEAELKSLREEIAYKDERSRQLQVQHADELARMRSVHQEQSSRLSHLQLALDEKDHELKTLNGDLDKYRSELEHTKNRLKETETERNQNSAELVQRTDRCRALELECQGQADELVRIQSNLEDAKAKNNILQKRVEEREQRLRKIEGENHGLLDEIHGLRKSNHELESHIDVLRQRLLDRDERSPSTVPILPGFSQSGPGISPSVEKASLQLTAEVDRLKKQNIELEASNNKTKQALQDLQIKMDQLDYERSNLSRSYEEEREKRTRLEKELHGRDAKMQTPIPAESTAQANAQVEQLTLTVSQLKRDIERRDSQIQQLNQQIVQAEKLSKMSTATGSERDVLLNELKISLQRTQQALDEANEQNHLLQARTETTMLETQQQFLIQQQSLQQQIANLQQSLHEAGMNSDRLQKEVRQSSTRIQDLTRQLRETQANCDSIASQRDSLQSRIEQLQQSGLRSGGSIYGGRPASVAAGYSDLISSTTSTSQLSRELDRLHREQESMRNQLESAERSARSFKTEAENARAEVVRLKDELQQQKDMLNELQENLESREEEMSKRSKFETEKLKKQQQDLTNQIANLQKQVTAKDNLIEQLTSQLKTAQEKCTDTERRLAEAAKRLDSLDSQEEQAALERNQQQRLSYELETVKKELNLRETQFNQLTQKLNQAIKESTDQTQVIQELSRQLEAAKASTQQAERDVDSARRQAAAWANEQVQQQQLRLQSEQAQRGQEAAEALKAALEARDRAQQAAAALETELTNQREAMEAQAEIIRTSEERCKTSHVQEIERLNKETQELRRALDAASNNVKSAGADESLKQEIDFLKKEVSKRDAALGKLEKDCQEKHVRKLEVLQVQLKRYEEEAANLNRVLDEQRNGMEERDRLIRQLKSENQQRAGPSPELEKLKAEHAQCAQQIQQKQQQLETLVKQLEDQAEEILTTKIEALTASLAEKNANIALIETSGSTNASTQQAVSKLQTERDQLQKQLRQLSFARDALAEQRKMR